MVLDATNRNYFVCPSTKNKATDGPPETWADYVYVGGLPDTAERKVAMLICPPENHGGEFGCVVYLDRDVVEQLPANEIRLLIKQPWLYLTNSPYEALERLKREAKVQIPNKFQGIYRTDAK